MSLRTPPHLLADRWGIFISSCSSYRERQETQQSSFSGGCHPVMGTFLMAFAMLFIIPFMCAFFNSFSTNLCADSLLLFTPNVINLSFLQRKFIIWHYELLSIFQHRIWFNFLKLMTLVHSVSVTGKNLCIICFANGFLLFKLYVFHGMRSSAHSWPANCNDSFCWNLSLSFLQ